MLSALCLLVEQEKEGRFRFPFHANLASSTAGYGIV